MAQQKTDPVAQNNYARQLLLATALPVVKRVGFFTGKGLGETQRMKLLNTGLTTKLVAKVSLTVDIDATATKSIAGVEALLQNVTLTDYNQVERINTDGPSLAAIRGFKRRRVNDALTVINNYPTDQTSAEFFSYPTAIGDAQTIEFFIDIPFVVNDELGDLRGLSLSQAVVGEQYLSFTFASALTNADPTKAPYTAGTFDGVSDITVELYQHYYQPQDLNAVPLLDVSTIYEIKGGYRSSSDIQTNGQKLIPYPNVRNVFSSFHRVIDNNGAVNGDKLPLIRLLANSSQILREMSYAYLKRTLTDDILGDSGRGTVYLDHRTFPISTALYGNVQLELNFGTIVGGNTFALSTFESVYPSGTPLPGITTQG